jgi:CheY-like chemotaxis protein
VSSADERNRLAHDVMSPLAAIVGYAELLGKRDDRALQIEASAAILTAAGQLRTAVNALVDHDRADAPAALPPVGGPSYVSRSGRRRILIVEDEPVVRTLLRTTLSADLYEVWEASDGNAALAAVSGDRPSLVLLDWHLPTLSGPEVLAMLRAQSPHLPVIVLTGMRDPIERQRAERLGANVFLTKPFSPTELLSAIELLVDDAPPLAANS